MVKPANRNPHCHRHGHTLPSLSPAMKPLLASLLFLTAVSIARADLAAIENQYRAAYESHVGT